MGRDGIRHTLLLGCAAGLLFTPSSRADELLDAIIDVDPRVELESGVGVTYGSIYSPQDDPTIQDPATLEPTLGGDPKYQGYFEGLRSPLFEEEENSSTPLSATAPVATTEAVIVSGEELPPLGKPEQREGVWYEDDLSPQAPP